MLRDEWIEGAGDSFDPIKIGIGVGDRSGELRVLDDLVFFFAIPKQMYCVMLH